MIKEQLHKKKIIKNKLKYKYIRRLYIREKGKIVDIRLKFKKFAIGGFIVEFNLAMFLLDCLRRVMYKPQIKKINNTSIPEDWGDEIAEEEPLSVQDPFFDDLDYTPPNIDNTQEINPSNIFHSWAHDYKEIDYLDKIDFTNIPRSPLLRYKLPRHRYVVDSWRADRLEKLFSDEDQEKFWEDLTHIRYLTNPISDKYSEFTYFSLMSNFHYSSLMYPHIRDRKTFIMFFSNALAPFLKKSLKKETNPCDIRYFSLTWFSFLLKIKTHLQLYARYLRNSLSFYIPFLGLSFPKSVSLNLRAKIRRFIINQLESLFRLF